MYGMACSKSINTQTIVMLMHCNSCILPRDLPLCRPWSARWSFTKPTTRSIPPPPIFIFGKSKPLHDYFMCTTKWAMKSKRQVQPNMS